FADPREAALMAGGGGDNHPLCMDLGNGRLTFELATGEMIAVTEPRRELEVAAENGKSGGTQLLVCPTVVTASKLRIEAVPLAPEEEDLARLVWPDEFEEVPHTTFADLSALGLDGQWIPIGFTVVR